MGFISPTDHPFFEAYLLDPSFQGASCTRMVGDKGVPCPSTVLTVLGKLGGLGKRHKAVLLALLMLALEPEEE